MVCEWRLTCLAEPAPNQFSQQVRPNYLDQSAIAGPNALKVRKFDGSTDVEEFIDDFLDICGLYGWGTDMARQQLRHALVGGARICKREISVPEIFADLRRRFGESMQSAVEKFTSLKQGQLSYYNLVMK